MPPLVLGAGPAGCAAAIALAEQGAAPVLLDRDAEVRDQLCGGFLSWRTAEQLRRLGVDPVRLGARRVERVALFARGREVVAPLPALSFGLSRRALDGALRARALAAGSRSEPSRAAKCGWRRARPPSSPAGLPPLAASSDLRTARQALAVPSSCSTMPA